MVLSPPQTKLQTDTDIMWSGHTSSIQYPAIHYLLMEKPAAGLFVDWVSLLIHLHWTDSKARMVFTRYPSTLLPASL